MKKTRLLICLAVVFCLSLLCVGLAAADEPSWKLEGTKLTFSGDGEIPWLYDYYNGTPPWGKRNGVTEIVIEEGITGIPYGLFYQHTKLTTVTLPSSLTKIEGEVFGGCTSLTSITIPDGVTFASGTGGNWLFSGCTKLTSVKLPAAMQTIPNGMFYGCTALTSITIPAAVTEIGESAFSGCSKLAEVTVPAGVDTIGQSAFSSCSKLAKVKLPDGLTEIARGLFSSDEALTEINIPDTVTDIQNEAFAWCSKLKLTLPASVTFIGKDAFRDVIVYAKLDSEIAKLISEAGCYFRDPAYPFSMKYDDDGGLVVGRPVDAGITGANVPDGVVLITDNAFNSDGILWLRLPKSLKKIDQSSMPWNLKNVFYAGTEADRKKIEVEKYNEGLDNACWHYGENAPSSDDVWTITYDVQPSPNYDWSYLVTATAVCKNNPEHTVTDSVDNCGYNCESGNEPTCEEPGHGKIYVYFENNQFLNPPDNYLEVDLPARGHKWGEPEYTWGTGNLQVVASAHCQYDWNHEVKETVNTRTETDVEAGTRTYIAEFTNPIFTTQTKTVEFTGYDVTPPLLKKITIDTKAITKPGVIKVSLEFDENETGVRNVYVDAVLAEDNSGTWQWLGNGNYYDQPDFTGKCTINIPVSSKTRVGTWNIYSVQLEDDAGNVIVYNRDWENPNILSVNGAYPVSIDNGIKISEEFRIAFQAQLSSPDLLDKINAMPDGATAVINYDSTTHVVPAAFFEAIRNTNKTLVFSNNEYQWMINGQSVTGESKDVDLAVMAYPTDGEQFGAEGQIIQVDFPANGILPGKMRVRIKSDYFYQMYQMFDAAFLYYVEDEDDISLESSDVRHILDDTDHWCEFYVSHNSTYVITGKRIKGASGSLPASYSDSTGNYTIKGEKATWKPADPKATSVTIPDTVDVQGISVPVTAIADNACKGMKTLKSVKVGAKVTTIGKNAFSGCTALETVTLDKAKALTSIGDAAFKGCKKLKAVTVPAKVSKIGKEAFSGCVALAKVSLDKAKALTSIGDAAFKGCKKLAAVTIPAKVSKIGKEAFINCKALKTVTIKTTKLTKKGIGKNSFKGIYSKVTFKCPKAKLKNYSKWLLNPGGAPKKAKFTK